MPARSFNFAGLNLQQAPFSTLGTDAFSGPERDIMQKELARADNAVAVFRRFRSRTINQNGMIVDATSDALDLDIDALKLKTLFAGRGMLNIGYAGGTRSWAVEVQNCFITREAQDVSRAAWSIQYFSPKAYAVDGTTGTLFNPLTITAANVYSVFVAGTFLASPFFTLTINSISASGPVDITIGNPNSGEYLTIPQRTLAVGDTITIDTDNQQVFHNSTLVAASGYYPGWAPGNGSMEYSDTATARNITVTAPHEKRYL